MIENETSLTPTDAPPKPEIPNAEKIDVVFIQHNNIEHTSDFDRVGRVASQIVGGNKSQAVIGVFYTKSGERLPVALDILAGRTISTDLVEKVVERAIRKLVHHGVPRNRIIVASDGASTNTPARGVFMDTKCIPHRLAACLADLSSVEIVAGTTRATVRAIVTRLAEHQDLTVKTGAQKLKDVFKPHLKHFERTLQVCSIYEALMEFDPY
jgi:hypothetical protein